jgi:hypothetical protein
MPKSQAQETWEDLEIFTSKGAKIKDPKVTILDSSHFLFNAAFVHKAAIVNKSHVILGYSPLNKAITFQFTSDPQAGGACTIVHRSGGSSVGSRSFFNYFFLNPKELAGRYQPKKKKLPRIGDVWIIELDKKLPERLPET